MTVTLKIDKGTAERLINWKNIRQEEPKNLSGSELTLELRDDEVLIELHRKENLLEISDLSGSFGLWLELRDDKIQKFKEILEREGS